VVAVVAGAVAVVEVDVEVEVVLVVVGVVVVVVVVVVVGVVLDVDVDVLVVELLDEVLEVVCGHWRCASVATSSAPCATVSLSFPSTPPSELAELVRVCTALATAAQFLEASAAET
jgi:hypothetical protein